MDGAVRMPHIRNIAIIGGGPAGVAAAKSLLAEKAFHKIDVFEQRSTVAGVWNYTPENDSSSNMSIPQVDPDQGFDKPIWRETPNSSGKHDKQATFVSPLYERLEANLPKYLMQHSDVPFPDDIQLFPTHDDITRYLEDYAAEVRHMIQFETQVIRVEQDDTKIQNEWAVTTLDLRSQSQLTQSYDAVVVASGHYTIPFIPETKGIHAWSEKYPGVITHSKFFRRPEDLKNKKVLVIGTGPSGSDIANQIAQYCQQPIIISSRSNPHNQNPPPPSHGRPHLVPGIAEFLLPSSSSSTSFTSSATTTTTTTTTTASIRFADNQVLSRIDAVVFCTGYLYSYPFLPTSLTSPPSTHTPGHSLPQTYLHIFHRTSPTLTFLTLPWNIVPFPVAEAQAGAVARVYAGRLRLPSQEAMGEWEEARLREVGEGREFHRLRSPEDARYVNFLAGWCGRADGEGGGGGGGGGGMGKPVPHWGPRELWMRSKVGEFKAAFAARGPGRGDVKTLEELGFVF